MFSGADGPTLKYEAERERLVSDRRDEEPNGRVAGETDERVGEGRREGAVDSRGDVETDGRIVPVAADGTLRLPEELRESHEIVAPGSVRLVETADGGVRVESVGSVRELRGAGSSDEHSSEVVRRERERDKRRSERLQRSGGGSE